MTRLEKVEFLNKHGVMVSRKANSVYAEKKYQQLLEKLRTDAAEKVRRATKNKRRNFKKKCDKVKEDLSKTETVRKYKKKKKKLSRHAMRKRGLI